MFGKTSNRNLTKIVKYQPITEEITNPDRGVNGYWADKENERVPLNAAELIAEKDKKHRSVIYRHYMLSSFVNKPLTDEYLKFLEADAGITRNAGVKMIVRFSYEEHKEGCDGNVGASHTQIVKHLEQLRDYFENNSDVITVVEAGFIGTYGEWYYAHKDFGACDNPNYTARADFTWKLLEILPSGRMIAIRTPELKRGVVAAWTKQGRPATQIAAFGKRIGFHDDVFNVDASDMGTFNSEADRIMVTDDTKVSPMLGETSYAALDPTNKFSKYDQVTKSAKRYHWSLISGTDDGYVFSSGNVCKCGGTWTKADSCDKKCEQKQLLNLWTAVEQAAFRRSLGYRFVLVDGAFPEKVNPGNSVQITLKLKNEGWATPFNHYGVKLILRDSAGSDWILPVVTRDPSEWFWDDPDKVEQLTLSAKLLVGDKPLPPGDYQLLLRVVDTEYKSGDIADFSIRFANKDLWEESTGLNRLNAAIKVASTP